MNAVSPMPALPPHRLSIVVPMYQEEDSVAPFVARVSECLALYPHPWELLLVNDGSRDGTRSAIEKAQHEYGPHIRLIELARNYKQTAAMQAGIDHARGDVIATLDGDLQNDPVDIPAWWPVCFSKTSIWSPDGDKTVKAHWSCANCLRASPTA